MDHPRRTARRREPSHPGQPRRCGAARRHHVHPVRLPAAARVILLVLDEPGSHVLLTWRHRFIVGKWVWELPRGYVDDGEDGAATAVREAEEETGWRPRGVRFVLSYQPMIGNADFPQDLYLARGADLVREPAAEETAAVRWVPLDEAAAMISSGEIVGAGTIIGIQHALMLRAAAQPLTWY